MSIKNRKSMTQMSIGQTQQTGQHVSRRQLLRTSALGFGSLALASLLECERARGDKRPRRNHDVKPRPSHFPAQVKAVIMMMQNGGPSQMDLFDPKPELAKRNGQRHIDPIEQFQTGSEANKLLGGQFKFQRHGESGIEISEALPKLGSLADDLCLIRSMHSEHNNHTEALVLLNTGKIFPGRPALGSWITYGLGSENQNLPAYIVLRDPDGYNTSGTLLWQNGWLPAMYRGTEVSTRGAPVLNLRATKPTDSKIQRGNLNLLAKLNRRHQRQFQDESDLEARIQNYELAARMQLAAPALLDLSKETATTQKLYGLDNPTTAGYGLRCLMARRLVESGVRFVQIFPPVKPSSQPWDSHGGLKTNLKKICDMTDQPSAALIKDLKARGLLESTLVIWSGEFGRLPISQNGTGRDHNRNAFTMLLAGGGFKKGVAYGQTDELGYRSVEKRVSVQDFHATVLNQMGLDHQRLSFPLHGSTETLTDSRVTNAKVVTELLAKNLKPQRTGSNKKSS